MRISRSNVARQEVVTFDSQDEHQRISMIIMQLEMALELARYKNLCTVQKRIELAIAKANFDKTSLLN